MKKELSIVHGRKIMLDDGESTVEIRGENGNLELQIRVGPDGPSLLFGDSKISLISNGDISLDCTNLKLHTKENLICSSEKDIVFEAENEIRSKSFAQDHQTRRGDFSIKANDDVVLNGERVMLNTPKISTPDFGSSHLVNKNESK